MASGLQRTSLIRRRGWPDVWALRLARLFRATILIGVPSTCARGPFDPSPELESRVEAIWQELRNACSMELDGGVVARLAAQRRDPEPRRTAIGHWADWASSDMKCYWRRGTLGEAVRVYAEWAAGALTRPFRDSRTRARRML